MYSFCANGQLLDKIARAVSLSAQCSLISVSLAETKRPVVRYAQRALKVFSCSLFHWFNRSRSWCCCWSWSVAKW
jgi:hypothetical protein